FTIAENTGHSDRTATIAFTSADDSITRTFTVKQDAAPEPVVVLDTLTVSPSQASFPYSGGSTTVTVDANVSYSVSSDAEWIAMTGGTDSTAIGGTTRKKYIHTFTAAANDGYSRRSATITFCNADNSIVRTFNVIQDALPFRDTLTISPDNAEFTKEGGTATITVESNVPYLVTAGADWISSGGDPDSTAIAGTTRKKYAHTFAIAANSAYSSRSAKIAFSSRDNSITRTFTVTQDALTLRDTLAISPSSADLGLEGGSTAVTVDANVRYSVAISEPWITSNGESDSSSIDGTTRKHYFHS
ncbi:MAG: BACON domain-containing protein, partial [Bacteroidales bacterium]